MQLVSITIRRRPQSNNDLLDRENGIAEDLLPVLWRVNRLGDTMADDQSYKRARDAVFKALSFPMVDENGSVFPNSIVVTRVPDYNLPRLRTEATMKWDDAKLKRQAAVHGTSPRKRNIPLTPQSFITPIPDQSSRRHVEAHRYRPDDCYPLGKH
ncbi:hypothetical protein CGMCC3_g418 [Colletotrichum fructicola]|nr:uncharacterized protein CGMCC3_g418 [Colletotrichum fructicola]KAE9583538.1 hypothetical protein CGMCC3_g418 [Colletotrichum fructicola]